MLVSAKMVFLGVENGTNREGKPFTVCGLLQGFNSERIYISEDNLKVKLGTIKPMSEVDCQLNISIGNEKTYVNLVDIKEIGGK